MRKRQNTAFFFVVFFCSIFLFSHCKFPRIIVLKDPLSAEEHVNLGVAYEKKGELDAAIKEYKQAAKKLPVAYLYLGNTYFQRNELEKAETFYKKAIEKEPGTADAYNNLAWLYVRKKENLKEAERLVLKALALNPSKENIYRDTLTKIRQMEQTPRERN
jgi:tetratricopeptide (TPR) repeat protein